jgi:segregation and condensation protein B
MRRGKPDPKQPIEAATNAPKGPPLSLNRLREAFAAMLGGPQTEKPEAESRADDLNSDEDSYETTVRTCEINARTVVEAMLFVGRPDNAPLSARELAAAMRGVSPSEIESAVAYLNALYKSDGAPYLIEQTKGGYRLVLRGEFERMRDKFYGRVKEARLSPAVLEVLSVLAYNQPATAEELNELRGGPSGAALSTLVRRKLVTVERIGEGGKTSQYSTTERFLKLFGLDNLDALPRTEDLEKV